MTGKPRVSGMSRQIVIKQCPKCKHELVEWGYDHSGQVYKCPNNHYVRNGKEIGETNDTKVVKVHTPDKDSEVPTRKPRRKVEGKRVQRPTRRHTGKVVADAKPARKRRSRKASGTGSKRRAKAAKRVVR